MGIVSGVRFVILIQEDKIMNKKIRNIVLVVIGILAVAGVVVTLVEKNAKSK